jgi:hypothetical protein
MAKRTIYDVRPHGGGPGPKTEWSLKKRGNKRASGQYENKKDAIARGRQLAEARTPAQLIVHTADGKVEKEFTYGNDPFPPKG